MGNVVKQINRQEPNRNRSIGRILAENNTQAPFQSQHPATQGRLYNDVLSGGAHLGRNVWNGVNSFISPGAYAKDTPNTPRISEQQLRQFNADVERKRREEELVRQNAQIYQMMNDYSEYQNAQHRAQQRNFEARRQQQRQQAQQRIIEAQVKEETDTPPKNSVPDIIHMPALQHALEKRRVKLVNTRPLDENANLHYAYTKDNRTQYHPPAAALDPGIALYHYMYGNGRPLTIQMKDIRLDNLENHQDMPDFKVIAKALRHDRETELELAPRSISLPVSNLPDKASLGTVTIQLTGTVRLTSPRHWVFQGTIMSPNGDRYDFNPSTHRTDIGEWSTWVGSQIPGIPYPINIEGEQYVEFSGYFFCIKKLITFTINWYFFGLRFTKTNCKKSI